MKPKHYLVLGCMGILDCVVISAMVILIVTSKSFQAAPAPNAGLDDRAATAEISPSASTTASTTPSLLAEWTAALTPVASETPTETGSPAPGAELQAQVWQTFQTYLGFLKAHDVDSANALMWPSVRMDMPACIAQLSEKTCWGLVDALYGSASTLKGEDFANVWADDKQIILSSDPAFTPQAGEVDASRSYLYFVFDPQGRILFLQLANKSWNATTEDEVRQMMLDSDQDGLTDSDETCLHQPGDMCTKTDPGKRDTDGDGYWDSIEEAAKTDPNDPASHL
jgi:hypothetical protein